VQPERRRGFACGAARAVDSRRGRGVQCEPSGMEVEHARVGRTSTAAAAAAAAERIGPEDEVAERRLLLEEMMWVAAAATAAVAVEGRRRVNERRQRPVAELERPSSVAHAVQQQPAIVVVVVWSAAEGKGGRVEHGRPLLCRIAREVGLERAELVAGAGAGRDGADDGGVAVGG